MNAIYAFFSRIAGFKRAVAAREPFHDDRLRANQFNGPEPPFSFWRALVS